MSRTLGLFTCHAATASITSMSELMKILLDKIHRTRRVSTDHLHLH